jgi:hypothetical protein
MNAFGWLLLAITALAVLVVAVDRREQRRSEQTRALLRLHGIPLSHRYDDHPHDG